MKNISFNLESVLKQAGCDEELLNKRRRIKQVKEMWAAVVEDIFLDHTNSVYIINDEVKGKEVKVKKLIVYVDDSIISAELNARRELIKLKFKEKFQEDIEEFEIHISHWKTKNNYLYKNDEQPSYIESAKSIPLTSEELDEVKKQVGIIKNDQIRKSLYKAMVTDLEWKKGISEQKSENM